VPNYKYKCTGCENSRMIDLPMSSNPSEEFYCEVCKTWTMTRRIISGTFCVERNTLGSWYKNATGNDLLGEH
jgi:predicted nucleic acid-binding Zn ribbon protein